MITDKEVWCPVGFFKKYNLCQKNHTINSELFVVPCNVIKFSIEYSFDLSGSHFLARSPRGARELSISFDKICKQLKYLLCTLINKSLKGIMDIFIDPHARWPILPRIPPENFKSIGPAITEQLPKMCFAKCTCTCKCYWRPL